MIVVVCPGQGSQTPGFLEAWLEHDMYRDQLAGMSQATDLDLALHGTESNIDTIRDTTVAQPLIVAAGLLTLSVLLADGRRDRIGGVAGHSVGEVTAAAASGVLSDTEAIQLVRERSLAMADAAALSPTGMSAVIGADENELMFRLGELGLEPANFNGGGQVVVAGALDALAELAENPPARARVVPLQVAGAFHTHYMTPAVERLSRFASGLTVTDPTTMLWTDDDGSVVTDGRRFIDLLVDRVSAPVRWDRVMESMADAQVTGIIELSPAGALVGLAKRGLKGVPSIAIKTPDDIPAAIDLIDGTAA